MMNSSFSFCAVSLVTVLGLGSCPPSPTRSTVQVTVMPATTIEATEGPGGAVSVSHLADVELVGRKEAHLNIAMFEPTELRTALLTYWPAGHNAQSQTVEHPINRQFTPSTPGGVSTLINEEIPGAADFGQCERLYYMWTLNYRKQNGTPGIYIGEPQLILPTKRRVGNRIEQALCPAPSGPSE